MPPCQSTDYTCSVLFQRLQMLSSRLLYQLPIPCSLLLNLFVAACRCHSDQAAPTMSPTPFPCTATRSLGRRHSCDPTANRGHPALATLSSGVGLNHSNRQYLSPRARREQAPGVACIGLRRTYSAHQLELSTRHIPSTGIIGTVRAAHTWDRSAKAHCTPAFLTRI